MNEPSPSRELVVRWHGRLLDGRNRLIAHPRFQRWAATTPLVKRIANKRAGNLFDICAGFVYSQVLAACVRIELTQKLAAGPRTVADLAAACGFEPKAMHQLLRAAAPLGLVEARGRHGRATDGDATGSDAADADSYALGSNGAALNGNPGVSAMVAHHDVLYRDLADPVALFKSGAAETEMARFWPYATAESPGALGGDAVAPYSELMSSSLALLADDVLDAYTLAGHRSLMDVGGGGGGFLAAAARRRADLRVTLFDLPQVVARAAATFDAARLAERATTVPGDFKRDALPAGADAISLVRIAHDLDDDALAALLAKVHAALPANGVLMLAEPMAETPGARRVATYFTMYLLAMRRGRLRSIGELRRLLATAGFAHVQHIPTARPMLASLLVARKSAYYDRTMPLTRANVRLG